MYLYVSAHSLKVIQGGIFKHCAAVLPMASKNFPRDRSLNSVCVMFHYHPHFQPCDRRFQYRLLESLLWRLNLKQVLEVFH